MGVFLAIICIIWLIVIQNKLSDFTRDIYQLNKKIDKQLKINQEIIDSLKEPQSGETKNVYESIAEKQAEKSISNNQPLKINDWNIEKLEKELSQKPKAKSDFEKIFLGNIFNKIGAIAILIGLVIFIKLVSPFFVITPVMKISAGFIAGIGMLIAAFKLHKEETKNYAEVLMGTGLGTLFITTYCASSLFNLFTSPVTLIISTLILLFTFYIADKQKTASVLVIGLIAGYLNPFFISKMIDGNTLFGYLLFVNALSLVFTVRNQKYALINIINLIMTFLTVVCFIVVSQIPFTSSGSENTMINFTYSIALWVMYILYDIFAKLDEKQNKSDILNYVNFIVLTLFSLVIFNQNKTAIGLLLASAGIVYGGLAYYYSTIKSEKYKRYLHSMIAAAGFSTFFLSNGITRIALWSTEAFAIFAFANYFKLTEFRKWSFGFLSAAIAWALNAENIINLNEYRPLLNLRLYTFLAPMISSLAMAFNIRNSNDENTQKLFNCLKFICLSLVYIFVSFEINDALNHYSTWNFILKSYFKSMSYIIIGFLYSFNSLRMYQTTKYQFFKFMGNFVLILSFLYLIIEECYNYPQTSLVPVLNIRFAAYIAGISALCYYGYIFKSTVYYYTAVLFGFLLTHVETESLISKYALEDSAYLISVAWILYAGVISTTGIFKNNSILKISGIWITILSIIRIFVFDLANVNVIYKFIAFLTLGVILMLVSYFYNKNKN